MSKFGFRRHEDHTESDNDHVHLFSHADNLAEGAGTGQALSLRVIAR